MEREEKPIIPLPADALVDQDAAAHARRQFQHWLDEAYNDFVNRGGLDHLPGKGKPLDVPTGDVWVSIMKNAKASPPWVMLRKEIATEIKETLEHMRRKPDDASIDGKIEDINRKIDEMNALAPSLSLHRRKITRDNIGEQYERWT